MIADSLYIFAAVCDGASVPGFDHRDGSAGAGAAAVPFIILSRIGVVHRRVLVKSRRRVVILFCIVVYFRESFAFLAGDGCRRVVYVALYAGTTTVMITRVCAVDTVDPIRLHVAGQHEL